MHWFAVTTLANRSPDFRVNAESVNR